MPYLSLKHLFIRICFFLFQFNASLPIQNDDLSNLNHCMNRLFDAIETDAYNFIVFCEQILPTLVMPLMMATSQMVSQIRLDSFLDYFEIEGLSVDVWNDPKDDDGTMRKKRTNRKDRKLNQNSTSTGHLSKSFGFHFITHFNEITKHAFDGYVVIYYLISMFSK